MTLLVAVEIFLFIFLLLNVIVILLFKKSMSNEFKILDELLRRLMANISIQNEAIKNYLETILKINNKINLMDINKKDEIRN